MILRGIIDSSLNGQLCFRGFSPIKELERISKADYPYQRNPIEGREDIIDFLEKQTYLFFPEIILSYKFKHDFSKGKSTDPPIQAIQQNKKFKSNVDNTELRIKKVDYKSQRDSRGTTDIRIVELDLDDAELERLIEEKNQPFQRIDGNHRLRAAEQSEATKVSQMVAPFCILLGEEFYDNSAPQKNKETQVFDKSVKVFFHNINTKTIPLTSEQNLKVIIDDKENFPNDELKQILGGAAVRTRELIAKENPENFSGIAHIIQNQYRSYYIDIFRRLITLGEKQTTLVKKVFESLQAINVMYNENDNLKANSSFGLLTAFLYYHVQGNKAKFLFFRDWVLNNHIFEVEEIKAESLISIFDKIAENNVKIFVAMPFFSPEEVESYNNTYNKVIDEILAEYPHLNIERPLVIMQQEGKTFNIISDITNKIRNCSIFIADLSEINVNVIYELGFARSLKKPSILVCREDDFGKIPFDIDQDLRRSYKPNAHSTLEAVLKKDLIAILKDDFGYIADKKDNNAK